MYREELTPGVVRGQWHHRLPEGRVQCDLCPRYCKLKDGQRGFCFVRRARAGEVELTSYGRASGFCIDPIEKKPLNHFLPGSSVLSFGTAGCNLGCRFCQNWDISKAREMDRLSDLASPLRVARAARDSGCRSVAFTYNDPVVFAEYAVDCAHAARELGLSPIAVSAGYITEHAREAFFAPLDAVNIDLKAFTEEFYKRQCYGSLGPVMDTLRYLRCETSVWLEITTLLIPGHNDSEAEVERLCEFVVGELGPDVPLHFSAFHPDFKLTDAPPTPPHTLTRARAQARALGLRHVYTGNVHDAAGQSTYCAGCGELLIERDWYRIGAYRVRGGRCRACGAALAGRFEDEKGDWRGGRRRLPMHSSDWGAGE